MLLLNTCLLTRSFLDETGILIGRSHRGGICTGLLVGAVHSELVKGILSKVGGGAHDVWCDSVNDNDLAGPIQPWCVDVGITMRLAFMPPASCSALAIRMSKPAC